jgi:hypothetical protein
MNNVRRQELRAKNMGRTVKQLMVWQRGEIDRLRNHEGKRLPLFDPQISQWLGVPLWWVKKQTRIRRTRGPKL